MDKSDKISEISNWFQSGPVKYLTGSQIGCSSWIQAVGNINSGTGLRYLKKDGTSENLYLASDSLIDSIYSYISSRKNSI